MQLSSHIPQDIIDTIIDHIKDNQSLKSCATVSHSFLQPSQRKLFSVVHLRGLKMNRIHELHHILVTNPRISYFIRTLDVVVHGFGMLCVERVDKALTRILGMVSCLRSLSLEFTVCVFWELNLSREFRSALVDIFQSHSLATVHISGIRDFPLSVLGAFTHVKKLSLDSNFSVPFAPHISLAQLEVLDLRFALQDFDQTLASTSFSPISFPNLRRLSIDVYCHSPAFVESVIASIGSIEYLRWKYHVLKDDHQWGLTDVEFGVMENLKYLTFVGVLGEGELAFAMWERSIGLMVKHLKNPLVTKSLEVFAIGVEGYCGGISAFVLSNISWWKELDTMLDSLSMLRRVIICAELPYSFITATDLQAKFQETFPLLKARGIIPLFLDRTVNLEKRIR